MPVDHLSEFLDSLGDRSELTRITAPVDSDLELATMTTLACRQSRSSALLFEQVSRSKFPVVTNLLGSAARLLLALGARSFDEVADRITAVIQPSLPGSWLDVLQMVPKFAETALWPPQVIDRGLAQQVVKMGRDVDLETLPIPRCWPHEKHAVITAAQVLTEWLPPAPTSAFLKSSDELLNDGTEPVPVRRQVSRTLLQVRDRSSLLVHWNPHDPEWQLLHEYRSRNLQMPVAVVLGGDPIMTFAAEAPLPAFVDPFVFAGFLRRKPVELVRARGINLQVPAHAEFVLEGLIDPQSEFELAPAVGLRSGVYSEPERVPVMTVTAITHRANPVFPAIVLASDCELDWYEVAYQRIFMPLLKLAVPELVDLVLPTSGAFRNIAFVSIRKTYPLQAQKVMNALWGLDRLCRTKLMYVVDADVDVHDETAVMRAVAANIHPIRDVIFSAGPADRHDHACPVRGVGSRMGCDATRKLPDEGHPRQWPESLKPDAAVLAQILQDAQKNGVVKPPANR